MLDYNFYKNPAILRAKRKSQDFYILTFGAVERT